MSFVLIPAWLKIERLGRDEGGEEGEEGLRRCRQDCSPEEHY